MWPDILNELAAMKRATWTLVSQSAHVGRYADGVLSLAFDTQGRAAAFSNGAHPEFVRQALIKVLGLDAKVEAVVGQGQQEPAAQPEPTTQPESSAPAEPERDPEQTPEPRRSTRSRPTVVAPEHDVPDRDDPDAEDSGLVGHEVVEQLLGGRVIRVDD
jgi:DNA polymerase-3 subunit gamma/tau